MSGLRIAQGDQGGDPDLIGLGPGDSMQFTVTHEITVDGEKSWVKFGCVTTVGETEGTEGAFRRLEATVNAGALKGVTSAVTAVRGYLGQGG